ncbi:MAG: DMT family transporter, partial [Thermoanaerobaculia bacterium]
MLSFLLMILTTFLFSSMAALIKGLEGEIPPTEIVFLRSIFSLPLLYILNKYFNQPLFSKDRFNIMVRSLSGFIAMIFYFKALHLIPLALASFLYNTQPIFVALFSPFFLGEKIKKSTIISIFLGISGIFLILKPGFEFNIASIYMLISASTAAIAHIFIRKTGMEENPLTVVFDFTLILAIFSGLLTIPFFVLPSKENIIPLILISLLAALGQITMTIAYTLEEAQRIAPIGYFGVLFATLYGYLFWKEIPDPLSFLGGVLIISGGLFLFWKRFWRFL